MSGRSGGQRSGFFFQATGGEPSLRDWDTVRRYKRGADRWGMMIPSLAGVCDRGGNFSSPRARDNLNQSIQAGEILSVRTVLIAAYGEDVPDLSQESPCGSAVEVLREVASRAADAGIILGLETSLSPADHLKLVNWVGHCSVQVYYDVLNMAEYGHTREAVPGISLLGKSHICQVHVKNDGFLIEQPREINWSTALEEFNKIGYEGWYVFETHHRNPADLRQNTISNIAFLRKHCRMPLG
jgi:L-ribulose-5-phosphate 3-epimerase